MKRQDALDRVADLVIQLKWNARLSLLLAAFAFESQLDKEEFLKNDADVRRCAKGLQVLRGLAFIGPVDLAERFTRGQELQALAHGRGYGFRQLRREIVQRSVDDAAEPPGRQPSLAGRF